METKLKSGNSTLTLQQNEKIQSYVTAKCILGENRTDWLNDAQLGNAISLLKSKLSVLCKLMYPLTMNLVNKMFNGEKRSKTLQDVLQRRYHARSLAQMDDTGVCSCLIQAKSWCIILIHW